MLLCVVLLLSALGQFTVSGQFQDHLHVCLGSGAIVINNLPPSEQPETAVGPSLSYVYFGRKYHWVLI